MNRNHHHGRFSDAGKGGTRPHPHPKPKHLRMCTQRTWFINVINHASYHSYPMGHTRSNYSVQPYSATRQTNLPFVQQPSLNTNALALVCRLNLHAEKPNQDTTPGGPSPYAARAPTLPAPIRKQASCMAYHIVRVRWLRAHNEN